MKNGKGKLSMEHLIIPDEYVSSLDLHETQIAIKTVKDFFQNLLAERLNLRRVSAPLFVRPESGLNDNLNGVERPVSFDIKESGEMAEVIHSLAKWKRYALDKYGFSVGEGLYTDMVAIRRDEETDNIHSIYVDQWDWEKIIRREDRNMETLRTVVQNVYRVLRKTEKYMAIRYDYIEEILPHDIFFITTSELEALYPGKTAKEREYLICREKGAVCLMQIGDKLASGEPHDGTSRSSSPPWGSASILRHCARSSKKQAAPSAHCFRSRKPSWKTGFPSPSAEESASPESVCSS